MFIFILYFITVIWTIWTLIVMCAIKYKNSATQIRKDLSNPLFEGDESILDMLCYISLLPAVLIMKFLYWRPFYKEIDPNKRVRKPWK